MEIYLLRHGIAEEHVSGQPDEERALTAEGRAKLKRVLKRARAAGVRPALILTSPLVRAVETADVAQTVLGGRIGKTGALRPDSTPQAVWQEIRRHKAEPAILLVGHEPLLGEVFGYLLGAGRGMVDLKKGALGRIDVERLSGEPRGVLCWLLTAKIA
ncbi:MAG TPA: histidine phosphatase family protein [Bryobacteraceae bacterium]|jgi:phosphohistidine phosphatase|nr:histidine phosphatase family protein [Bryobacteraceae bacterium]